MTEKKNVPTRNDYIVCLVQKTRWIRTKRKRKRNS